VVNRAPTYYVVADQNLTGYAQVLEERSALTGPPTVWQRRLCLQKALRWKRGLCRTRSDPVETMNQDPKRKRGMKLWHALIAIVGVSVLLGWLLNGCLTLP